MATTHDERPTPDDQAFRMASLERQAALAAAVERDSRHLLHAAHQELLHARAARENAEAQVVELEGIAAQLRVELEQRDARISDLKAQLERVRRSIPGRVWYAALRLVQ